MAALINRILKTNHLLRNSKLLPFVQCRSVIGENDKSTLTILNEELETGILINSYSRAGFRLNNGMMAIGPVVVFPKTILSWNVGSHLDINEESLSLFTTLDPKIDILVIGVGNAGNRIDPKIIQYMKAKKINLEVLPTERACAVFNFLNAENRCVAAALIPPQTVSLTEDDIASHQRNNKKFLVIDDDYI